MKIFLSAMVLTLAITTMQRDESKNRIIVWLGQAIGGHLVGKGIDHVINNPPKLPPKSPESPTMPENGGVIGGGRMGREF